MKDLAMLRTLVAITVAFRQAEQKKRSAISRNFQWDT